MKRTKPLILLTLAFMALGPLAQAEVTVRVIDRPKAYRDAHRAECDQAYQYLDEIAHDRQLPKNASFDSICTNPTTQTIVEACYKIGYPLDTTGRYNPDGALNDECD